MASPTFASLSIPNYRRYFIGGLISNIGSWMGRTALAWLVLMELTNGSASALGFLSTMVFLPGLILLPIAGTLADRLPKRTILLVCTSIAALDMAMLAGLKLSGVITLWMVYAIALIDGTGFAFDSPARQSFVSEIVGSEHLPNAIGLNSASFNTARLIGPGIAGLLIALVGTGWVFAINIVTFVAMQIALLMLDSSALQPAPVNRGRGQIVAGLHYLRHRTDLLILLICGFAVGGLGFNYQIAHAVMSTEKYLRGPSEYGIVGSLLGVGSLAAALWAARRPRPRLRFILGGMLGYIIFNLAAAYAPTFEIFSLLQIPVGFCTITALVTANTMLQSGTTAAMRGRVMSLWMLSLMGIAPIVSPVVGWLGDGFGPEWTLLFGVIAVAGFLVIITTAIMRTNRLSLHLDFTKPGWLWLRRGTVSENTDLHRH